MHRRSILAYFATLVPLFAAGKTESIRGRLKLAAPGKPVLSVSEVELITLRGDESTMGVLLDPRVRDLDFELIGAPTSMGAFEVGIMILTHPERFGQWNHLNTDCPGDEYIPMGDNVHKAPFFCGMGSELVFGASAMDSASALDGSVTGFQPQ